jgi:hypothetical protein
MSAIIASILADIQIFASELRSTKAKYMSQSVNTECEPDANPGTPSRTLAELEHIVEKGKATFIEVGEALAEIKERGLYKPEAWGDYVKRKYGFTRQYAHRLIQAMEWAKEASTTVDIPQTEHAVQKARKAEALKRSAPKKSKSSSPTRLVRMPSSIPVQATQPECSVPITQTELADPKWGLPLDKASVTEKIDAETEYDRFERQADLWVDELRSKDLMFLLARVIECCRELISEAKPEDREEEGADEDYSLSSVSELEEATAAE